jgi:glyoxylase-like metal-dependent hydrolase (beta-lactamase superfamily II)
MRVHHLNCATIRPPAVPEMVTHCLLVETESGPVLVDAGYGTDDIDRTRERMGSLLPLLLRPALQRSETAIEQVRKLGFAPEDVRHVILTHLDVDHVGGVSDFPWARVHLTRDEARGAFEGASYRSARASAIWDGRAIWTSRPTIRRAIRGSASPAFASSRGCRPISS